MEANSLTEDQLREAIIGKTIYLTISGFEFPIYYKSNVRMTGSMGQVAADAVMARTTAVAGGSKRTSFVRVRRVGWTGKPTATRSPVKGVLGTA